MIIRLLVLEYARRIVSQSRIREDLAKVYELMNEFFLFLVNFNLFEEDRTIWRDTELDKFEIPNEFKDFIIPNSIRLVKGDKRYPNLIDDRSNFLQFSLDDETLTYVEEEEKRLGLKFKEKFDTIGYDHLDPIEFKNLVYSIYKLKRDYNPACSSLLDLRDDVALMDVISKIPVNNKLRYEGTPLVPIVLNEDGMRVVSSLVGDYITDTSIYFIIREYPQLSWKVKGPSSYSSDENH